MDYISTRGGMEPIAFQEAVMTGLARDGGLLIPVHIPRVVDRLDAWRRLSFCELAGAIMSHYVDLPPAELEVLIARSYATFDTPEVTPVVPMGDQFILELFHGPTLAFKDVALQFLGNLFEYILKRQARELNILAATSGDTGSAAIHGVRSRERIRIFVMHPYQRVSPLQELQMTSVCDANVFNIAVRGTFDDCQNLMKAIFRDLEFRDRYALGSVNSINWARVLAQIVYYFYAAFRVMDRTGAARVRFAVPTGNFGDIFAGYVAARMGLPIGLLVLATNENDILARFFATGEYAQGPVHATLSPSMDIQVASNFERYLYYRAGENPQRLTQWMADFGRTGRLRLDPPAAQPDGSSRIDGLFAAGVGGRAATLGVIQRTWKEHGYLLDPHTAVGVHVAQAWRHPDEPMICLATAHPAKFSGAIREAIGEDVARHPILDALKGKPTRCEILPADEKAIRGFLAATIQA